MVLHIKTLKFSGQLKETKADPETAVCHYYEISGFENRLFYMVLGIRVKEDICAIPCTNTSRGENGLTVALRRRT